MATTVKTFDWSANADSFTFTPASDATGAWANIAGETVLRTQLSGRNKTDTGYWSRTLTFEDMGVPTGATISGITSSSIQSKVYAIGGMDAATLGNVTLSDGTTTVVLAASRTGPTGTAETSYTTQNGTDNTSLNWASNQSVTITLNHNLDCANNPGLNYDFFWDNLTFTITYTEAAQDVEVAPTAPDAVSAAVNTATVSLDVDITPAVEAVTVATHLATVALPVAITPNTVSIQTTTCWGGEAATPTALGLATLGDGALGALSEGGGCVGATITNEETSDVNVHPNAEAVTVATHQATVSHDREILPDTVNVAGATQAATLAITLLASFAAAAAAPQTATVALDRDVTTTIEAVTAAVHAPTVSLDVNITPNVVNAAAAWHAVELSLDVNILASTTNATGTPYAVDVAHDINVLANTTGVTATPYSASISADTTVGGTLENATVATQQATVSYDVEILPATEAVTAATHQASLVADTAVDATTEAVTVAAHTATITTDSSLVPTIEQAAAATHQAAITYDVEVLPTTEAVTAATQQADVVEVVDINIDAVTAAVGVATKNAFPLDGTPAIFFGDRRTYRGLSTTITHNDVYLGPNIAGRDVILIIHGSNPATSVTVGGVAATLHRNDHANYEAAVTIATVDGSLVGETATVVYTSAGTSDYYLLSTYAAWGLYERTPHHHSASVLTSDPFYLELNLNIPPQGVAVAAITADVGGPVAYHTWTGLTERYDEPLLNRTSSDYARVSHAFDVDMAEETGRAIRATWDSSHIYWHRMSAVSWKTIAPPIDAVTEAATTATHAATITYDVEVLPTTTNVNAVTIPAALDENATVFANTRAATTATYTAGVANDVNVAHTQQNASAATHAATIVYDVEVLASTTAATAAVHQASLAADTAIDQTTAAATVATHQASVALDVDIAPNLVNVSAATYAAALNNDSVVEGVTTGVTASAHAATITYDVEVLQSAENAAAVAYPATLTYDVDVLASTTNVAAAGLTFALDESTLITPLVAQASAATYTASLALDIDVAPSTEAVTVATHVASITTDNAIVPSVEAATVATHAATIAHDREVLAVTYFVTAAEVQPLVSLDVDITAGFVGVNAATYLAALDEDAVVSPAEINAVISALPAQISYDVNVLATTDAVTTATHAAGIDRAYGVYAATKNVNAIAPLHTVELLSGTFVAITANVGVGALPQTVFYQPVGNSPWYVINQALELAEGGAPVLWFAGIVLDGYVIQIEDEIEPSVTITSTETWIDTGDELISGPTLIQSVDIVL